MSEHAFTIQTHGVNPVVTPTTRKTTLVDEAFADDLDAALLAARTLVEESEEKLVKITIKLEPGQALLHGRVV